MTKFSYIATNPNKKIISGHLEAADRSTVLTTLKRQNMHPISIKDASKMSASSLGSFSFGKNKVKSDDLVIFTRQLSAMVGAGVPLLRALSSLRDHSESPGLKKTLNQILKDVQSGATLGDSLAKFPNVFSEVYVNMVRAGEAAGILDDILNRLAMQQEKNATIRKKVKSAMTYPTVLIVITVGAFFGLMIFVIPQIGGILKGLGGPDAKMPVLTEVMLGISHAMVAFWYIILPIFVGGIFGLIRFVKTKRGKLLLDRLSLKLPGVSGIVTKVAVARFSRTFSALMGAGVPVLESLEVTAHAVGSSVYEKAILEAGEAVKNGSNLSGIIESNPLFPAIVAQMIAVGEETGQTDKVLVRVADFYEEEVDVAIDGVSSIIEPVMIVFMGGMVGIIAASVMMPIAGLATSIKST